MLFNYLHDGVKYTPILVTEVNFMRGLSFHYTRYKNSMLMFAQSNSIVDLKGDSHYKVLNIGRINSFITISFIEYVWNFVRPTTEVVNKANNKDNISIINLFNAKHFNVKLIFERK